MTAVSASVELLTAEVRTLMVGNRQVTQSIYRQLDWTDPADIEPFGRVRDEKVGTPETVVVIGRHADTGVLTRASCNPRDAWFDPHPPEGVGRPYLKARIETKTSEHGYTSRVWPHSGLRVTMATDEVMRTSVSWYVGDVLNDPDGEPGVLYWIDPAEHAFAVSWAKELLDDYREEKLRYHRFSRLPLIVLAGLR